MAFHDLKLVFNMISLLHHFSCKYGIFADEIHFSLSIFKYLLDCEVSRQGVTSNISWTRGPKCARALCPGVPTHNLFFFLINIGYCLDGKVCVWLRCAPPVSGCDVCITVCMCAWLLESYVFCRVQWVVPQLVEVYFTWKSLFGRHRSRFTRIATPLCFYGQYGER